MWCIPTASDDDRIADIRLAFLSILIINSWQTVTEQQKLFLDARKQLKAGWN